MVSELGELVSGQYSPLHFFPHNLTNVMKDVRIEYEYWIWLMHNDSPPHLKSDVRESLDVQFRKKEISRSSLIAWPARLPVLHRIVFCLWSLKIHGLVKIYGQLYMAEYDIINRFWLDHGYTRTIKFLLKLNKVSKNSKKMLNLIKFLFYHNCYVLFIKHCTNLNSLNFFFL